MCRNYWCAIPSGLAFTSLGYDPAMATGAGARSNSNIVDLARPALRNLACAEGGRVSISVKSSGAQYA